MNCIIWKQARSLFGPFDKTHVITVKTILHSCSYCFFLILQPIKVDMEDLAGRKIIFIDDREGGAAYNMFHSFYLAKCMYKSGFAGAHITMKSDDFTITDHLPKTGSCIFYI